MKMKRRLMRNKNEKNIHSKKNEKENKTMVF